VAAKFILCPNGHLPKTQLDIYSSTYTVYLMGDQTDENGELYSIETATELFNSMLDAIANQRYFEKLTTRYSNIQTNIQIGLAITSILTTAEVTVRGIVGFLGVMYDILIVITSIITSILTIVRLDKKAKLASNQERMWAPIAFEYDMLWTKLILREVVDYKSEYLHLKEKSKPTILKEGPTHDQKLFDLTQQEVIQSMRAKGWMK